MKIEAIDLFCGIGGLTYGMRQAKIDVLAGLDNDETCRFPYEANNNSKFIEANIADYDFEEMKGLYSKGSIKVLVGCAPCQPFSSHSFKSMWISLMDRQEKHLTIWNFIRYFLLKSAGKIIVSNSIMGNPKTKG